MTDDLAIKDELNDATQDLRDTLHQLNDRVGERVATLRPGRGIRKHPLTSACIAGGLGFALGSDSNEVSLIGLFVAAAAIMLIRENEGE
jgi:hypothetical protein